MVNPVGIREAINKKQKVYFRILPLNLPILNKKRQFGRMTEKRPMIIMMVAMIMMVILMIMMPKNTTKHTNIMTFDF